MKVGDSVAEDTVKRNPIPQEDIADAIESIVKALDPDSEPVTGYKIPEKRMAFSLYQLAEKIQTEGGLYAKVPVHVCSSSEYDHDTLKPKVKNPEKDTFYLVPDFTTSDDMFIEWIYTGRRWERWGSGGAIASYLSALADVRITDVADGQILVYNAQSEKWENTPVELDCYDESDFE